MTNSWDAELIARQPGTSLVSIAGEGRLVRHHGGGTTRVALSWVDASALALIDAAVARRRGLCLVYPAPAGQLAVLLAAELLLHAFVRHGGRAARVGVVTADSTLAARTWDELGISTRGDRVPISEVFPCWRATPDGASPFGRREVGGLLLGERCRGWRVDVLIEDHLAGPVRGDRGLPTVALFADPLDRDLAARGEAGDLLWGWSEADLASGIGRGSPAVPGVPFSVAHERLETMARGVAVALRTSHHPEAELAVARVRDDLRALRDLAGGSPPRYLTKGMAIAWHHLQTLVSLPCTPSQFDRFAGLPPWAPRATATFEPEITAWARTLGGDVGEVAVVLGGDLADLRAALDGGNPFQFALEDALRRGTEALVVTRSRAAGRALMEVLGADPDADACGGLTVCALGRLSRSGTRPMAIVVGTGAPWDWHRIDSGIAPHVEILVLGDEAGRAAGATIDVLRRARRRWASTATRGPTWRALFGTEPPPAPAPTAADTTSMTETLPGPRFVPTPDPFDPLSSLLDYIPLRIGGEGVEERLATAAGTGGWTAVVQAVEVTTDHGRIRLEVGQPVEVRVGSRILDEVPERLEPGTFLLVGRRRGRLGLLDALEERLAYRRPDLLAGRFLIEDYHRRVHERFASSGLSVAELRRKLSALGCDKTLPAVRSWVEPGGRLAPRSLEDLRRLDRVLDLQLGGRRIQEIFAAVQRRRGFRRSAGRVLAEAARSSTVADGGDRIDPGTGLSLADLRDAVIEARIMAVDPSRRETPLAEIGQLEET